MRRGLALLFGLIAAVTIAGPGPAAAVGDAPLGRLGDTLRIQTASGILADVTLHDVSPTPVPPGWTWTGHPGYRESGGPWRAGITLHIIETPTPFDPGTRLTFRGATAFGEAYVAKHTQAPDDLDLLLLNAPAGSTVTGGVYWHVYRELVTHVVALDSRTGERLAQWTL